MRRPRVILADDHRMLCEAFARLLEPVCEVVAHVCDGRAALDAVETYRPEIVILDVSMPLLNGIEVARKLRAKRPEIRLIFLTMNEDPEVAAEAFRVGAAGYLLKSSAASELQQAISEAQAGRCYISPRVARELMDSAFNGPLRERPDLATPRQREVLQLLVEGHTMKEIAQILKIKPRTVAFHKYTMMKELGVESTAELIRFAVKSRLIP